MMQLHSRCKGALNTSFVSRRCIFFCKLDEMMQDEIKWWNSHVGVIVPMAQKKAIKGSKSRRSTKKVQKKLCCKKKKSWDQRRGSSQVRDFNLRFLLFFYSFLFPWGKMQVCGRSCQPAETFPGAFWTFFFFLFQKVCRAPFFAAIQEAASNLSWRGWRGDTGRRKVAGKMQTLRWCEGARGAWIGRPQKRRRADGAPPRALLKEEPNRNGELKHSFVSAQSEHLRVHQAKIFLLSLDSKRFVCAMLWDMFCDKSPTSFDKTGKLAPPGPGRSASLAAVLPVVFFFFSRVAYITLCWFGGPSLSV